MILLVDNYDSFVHNLARYIRRLGQETLVVRNDALDVSTVRRLAPQAIVLSPGPCTPREAGNSLALVSELYHEFPLLGVCLGHQTLAAAFGAKIIRAPEPMHGRTSQVTHDGTGLFTGIPSPFAVCRYHSLIIDEQTLPVEFSVTARSWDNIIMAFQHNQFPLHGVQFHPEATLTEHGFQLLANFLYIAGIKVDKNISDLAESEFCFAEATPFQLPLGPVTF
ncbi:MAG: aminodeoxychorismate/anthranilate synthase component II [Bythopirellula sp.]|nr:aminodeoxychorismate/anthranilate synthase component II [Bythopirellula sp.]